MKHPIKSDRELHRCESGTASGLIVFRNNNRYFVQVLRGDPGGRLPARMYAGASGRQ